jgi:hypothetical protein
MYGFQLIDINDRNDESNDERRMVSLYGIIIDRSRENDNRFVVIPANLESDSNVIDPHYRHSE